MIKGRYNIPPKPCVMCGKEYRPNHSIQRYCKPCRPKRKKETTTAWYYNNLERARARGRKYYHANKEYFLVKQRERYDRNERFRSEIANNTDFINNVRKTILRRRGDTITVRPIRRRVFKDMELTPSPCVGEIQVCENIICEICEGLGGVQVDKTSHGGVVYQFRRKVEK